MAVIHIVDDTPGFRGPAGAMLRSEGFQTVYSGNGKEALELLQERSVDLILLDVAMPVMDGLTFLKKLRSNPKTRDIPVIMLTAMAESEVVKEASTLNIDGYLL